MFYRFAFLGYLYLMVTDHNDEVLKYSTGFQSDSFVEQIVAYRMVCKKPRFLYAKGRLTGCNI